MMLQRGGKTWFVGIWGEQFRMAYLFFRRGYSFRIGFLNRRLEVGITKTHWHPDMRRGTQP